MYMFLFLLEFTDLVKEESEFYYTIIGKSRLGCALKIRIFIFSSGLYQMILSSFGQ